MKIDLLGVNKVVKRSRKTSKVRHVYYYHRKTGLRLPDDPQSALFIARLEELNKEQAEEKKRQQEEHVLPGTFGALIAEYTASQGFLSLSKSTQKDYGLYLPVIKANWGKGRVEDITREEVFELRDAYNETPSSANKAVAVLSALLSYAVDRPKKYGLKYNPALRIKKLAVSQGYRPWEDWEIEAFQKRWPEGTQERVAFELMLNVGQRAGDIYSMQRQQYRDGWITLTQSKEKVRLSIPASSALSSVLDPWLARRTEDLILTTPRGCKFDSTSFSKFMRIAYRAADLPEDCVSHGLRYTAATILRELGCDRDTIKAITGHKTEEMARKYSEQKKRASEGIAVMDRNRKPSL